MNLLVHLIHASSTLIHREVLTALKRTTVEGAEVFVDMREEITKGWVR